MTKRCYIVFVLLFCAASLGRVSVAISRPSSVVLENNEFKHLLVAIDDNVADNPTLIQNIKDTFTKASAFLYSATNHRAVFRDVTILVPAGWSNTNNAYAQATSQMLVNADVIFTSPMAAAAPPPSSGRAEKAAVLLGAARSVVVMRDGGPPQPFGEGEEASVAPSPSPAPRPPAMTKVYAGCGHQGVRVTLTTDVLTDRRLAASIGPAEKVLVHEWSHFRWGVFDEYALDEEPQFYFSPKTGKLEGVRCTELIKGILSRMDPVTGKPGYCRDLDPNTGLYPEGCKFRPYPAGPYVVGVEASIMDRVNIRPMSKFCDDQDNNSTRHNYDAPSRHNRLCGHRSTWDVIQSSQDFAGGANPSREGVDTAPVFTVVQAHATRRLLLALDTSASMADDNKLTRMKQAVATIVHEGVAPATQLGLATFSESLHLQRAPQALNSTQDRQKFADDLPDTQSGATDITLALTSAAQVFQDTKSSPPPPPPSPPPTQQMLTKAASASNSSPLPATHHAPGHHVTPSRQNAQTSGHVVVVTDGQETSGSDVTSALPLLQGAGVVVSFVVLGRAPQPALELLAERTGGRIYYDRNDHSSTAATDALFDVLDSSGARSQSSPVQILSRAEGLSHGQSLEGHVSVDRALGNKTTFLVAYDVTLPAVTVTSPSGRVYSHLYPEYSLDDRLKMVKILVPVKAEFGRWRYKIQNTGRYQRVSLLVLSSPSSLSAPPARLTGMLMTKRHALPTTSHVFAEVTRGRNPVTGLTVKALINTPDGAREEVKLFDNGAGADIVENDGVYSRFFSRLSTPGVYTVQLVTTGQGADTTTSNTDASKDPNYFVQRSASAGHIVVWPKGNKTSGAHASTGSPDTEAPVRISDLRVVKTSGKNRTVVLSWRASGDDTDRDTASHYEVYVAPTAKDLLMGTSHMTSLTQHDVIHGNLVAPKPFGSREFYMVRIPDTLPFSNQGSFVFTVIAVDEAGNRGEHSNYVTVGLGKVPDVTDHRYWKEGQFQAATPQLAAPQSQRPFIAAILGTTSGLLVLVIIVTVLVSVVTERKVTKKCSVSTHNYLVEDCEKGKKTNVFSLS
ncbi:calcium-activated chloride channel regulator 1-like [Babylonia areolata]|uniref:calcium-activated chloride channel regulator 1-like n=1 Tax=Babylonia areolata TaxID=304850 RepID=UPI003FD58D3F